MDISRYKMKRPTERSPTSWHATKVSAVIFLVVLLLTNPLQAFAAVNAPEAKPQQTTYYFTQNGISITCETDYTRGTLTLMVTGTEKDVHARLTHDETIYGYHLISNIPEIMPLNMGEGEYSLKVFLYVTPSKGKQIWESTFSVELDSPMAPWLHPSRIVNWTSDMTLVETAASLSAKENQKATALAIGNYIATNYTYDESKASLPTTYLPDLQAITQDKTGICYDFAALYAAMCRSQGIPCRLMMGYTTLIPGVYHAWCEVYVGEQWLTLDPTYCIAKNKASFLDASQMQVLKYY